MFRFFTEKNWYLWSWLGSSIILSSLWIQVNIDVKINEWFGEFYDMIQKALGAPNAITIEEYWASLLSFIILAAMYVGVAVLVSFFTSHYLFRWRAAMVEWYHSVYDKALIWSIGGTIFLVLLGLILRLVGVEYDLQKKEAAYRKILVIAEDDGTIRPKSIDELFEDVRSIHYLSYLRYLYFNIGRIAYLQANVLSAYVFLAPAIVAGAVTLGVMQQIIRAFGRVEGSMQYILKAWPTIIELASVYKRLREFEYKIKQDEFVDEKI